MKKRSLAISLSLFGILLLGLFIVNLFVSFRGTKTAESETVYFAPPYDHYRVFVTHDGIYNGNLSGLAGADTICQNTANSQSLNGTWKAWLSDLATSPSISFFKSDVSYKLLDGTRIAGNWTDLIDGSLDSPINVSQFGTLYSGIPGTVVTATNTSGSFTGQSDCNGWTSSDLGLNFTHGSITTTGIWTENFLRTCFLTNRLYCFEQPWCGNGLTENAEECDDGNTIDTDDCSNACISKKYYRVFASNQTYNGSLGGLSGADALCQNVANSAILDGTWKAWISDSTINASQRIMHSTFNYKLVNGNLVAYNWDDLIDGTLINAININEFGSNVIGRVITTTDIFGDYLGNDCNGWTSSDIALPGYNYGTATSSAGAWTQSGGFISCSSANRLYCFEQSRCGNSITESGEQCEDGNTANGDGCTSSCLINVCGDGFIYAGIEQCDDNNVVSGDGCSSQCIIEPHYRVFASSQTYNGSLGGVSGANQKCQNLADSSGLGGNWLAWIGDSTSFPSVSFLKSTFNYRLVNGVNIANNWNDLTDGDIDNFINVNESGQVIPSAFIWTGTLIDGNTNPSGHCGNWTSDLNSYQGTIGRTNQNGIGWTQQGSLSCDSLNSLYCFEQSRCGNSIIESGEECDDGNTNNGDGCSSSCVIETSPPGTGGNQGGSSGSSSGSGSITPSPQCRDNNDNDADGKIDLNDPGCVNKDDNSEQDIVPIGGGCVEQWNCGSYGECVNEIQSRVCVDASNCGTLFNMPSLEQLCGGGSVEGGEERQALGAMVIGLMLISTFIVTLLIVSVVIKEAAVLREAGKLAQEGLPGASPEDYAKEKEEVYVSMQQKQQIPNVQYAAFLVFALTMVYYLVYVALGFLTPVSLSPGFWLVSGSGIAMLVFILALLVIVLGMSKVKIKKSIHI